MNREMVAWAAGLFEGEGCITCQPDRPHQPRLQLGSTDRDVVERFAEVVGCGSVSSAIRPARLSANPKPLWLWTAVSNNAITVLESLLPYLGQRRTARALEVMKYREAHIAEATKERYCAHCKAVFRPQWSVSSTRTRFCSRRCQIEANQASQKLKRRKAAA